MEINWVDRVGNIRVLQRVKEGRKEHRTYSKQELVTSCVGTALYNTMLKGRRGRRR